MSASRYAALIELMAEDERAWLQRLAIPRRIDGDVVRAVLDIDDDAQVQAILDHPLLRKVGRDDRIMNHDLRAALLYSWTDAVQSTRGEVPAAISDINARLYRLYRDRDGGDREALYHRLAINGERDAAMNELGTLVERYSSAAELDVARAHDLLRLLEYRPDFQDAESEELASQLRARLARWSLWARERESTSYYLERGFERQAWQLLSADDERWILQLHAPGGAGKTMFVRHLLGRVCPREDIPAARMDFDYVAHLVTASNQPWRLLLNIAEQLDQQIPGQPFEHMLARWGRFAARTYYQALDRRRSNPRRVEVDPEELRAADAVPHEFRALLAEARGRQPVVVVLDTLEWLLHTENATLMRIIDAIAEVRSQDPSSPGASGLRLVLAGRFDLAGLRGDRAGDRLTGFRARYVGHDRPISLPEEAPAASDEPGADESAPSVRVGDQVITIFLAPFSDRDARTYLVDKRGLDDDERVTAIVERARGNPLKLSMLADLARGDRTFTAARILAFESTELFYLIDRVVDRIADPGVRWLVRWGVIPRVLTRDFAARVLWPLLGQQLGGGTRIDAPENDALPPTVRGQIRYPETWEPPSFDAVWGDLMQYVAAASWVTSMAELPDAVAFHPEVRDPLRHLLRSRRQPVYDELNRRALQYWRESVAELSGQGRGVALRAVIFHAFDPWSDRPKALEVWREVMVTAGDDLALRAELASEVLDVVRRVASEFDGHQHGPAPEIVAEAHAELDRFLASSADRGQGEDQKPRSRATRSFAVPRPKSVAGDDDRARQAFREERFAHALALYRERGDRLGEGQCLLALGLPDQAMDALHHVRGPERDVLVDRALIDKFEPHHLLARAMSEQMQEQQEQPYERPVEATYELMEDPLFDV